MHLDLSPQLPRALPHRLRERVQGDLQGLLHKAKDIQFAPVHQRVAGRLARARLRVFVRQPHLAKRAPAVRALGCHCAPEADLQEDIHSVPAALANEVEDPVKDPSADSVPAQPAEQEFRKLNPASRFMRANRPRRAAVL
jgi:hypothetical protein